MHHGLIQNIFSVHFQKRPIEILVTRQKSGNVQNGIYLKE